METESSHQLMLLLARHYQPHHMPAKANWQTSLVPQKQVNTEPTFCPHSTSLLLLGHFFLFIFFTIHVIQELLCLPTEHRGRNKGLVLQMTSLSSCCSRIALVTPSTGQEALDHLSPFTSLFPPNESFTYHSTSPAKTNLYEHHEPCKFWILFRSFYCLRKKLHMALV